MLLTEAAGKGLLHAARVPTASGTVVTDPEQLLFDGPWQFPVAAKAQVQAGGRGKAGGIIRCDDLDQLTEAFTTIMSATFAGERPTGILVEPWLMIDRELYLSVVVDPAADGFAVLYSPTGGIEIESAENVVRHVVGDARSFRGAELRTALTSVEPDESVREQVITFARSLLDVAVRFDATTVEVNPLAVASGRLTAVDAKVVVDDSAAFRQDTTSRHLTAAHAREDEIARLCRMKRLVFVPLGGSIGLISGGAGMTMRAMDAIAEAGGAAAGFLDISNNPTPDGVRAAAASLHSLDGVDRILVSIFGGGLDVGRLAKSFAQLIDDGEISLPVAFRLSGSGREAATAILAERGIQNHETLESAVAELRESAVVR